MGGKFVFILKLLVGGYLIFVGTTLLRTVLDVRPSNLQVMGVVSAIFILTGSAYILSLFWGVLKRRVNAPVNDRKETEMPAAEKPLRDGAMFRTAPMAAWNEEEQDAASKRQPRQERETPEKATVQLHTVGPDTMVWEENRIK